MTASNPQHQQAMGQQLRRARQQAGMRAVDVAVDLHMHHTRLSRIERGKVLPEADELEALLARLGVDVDIADGIRTAHHDATSKTHYRSPVNESLTRIQERLHTSSRLSRSRWLSATLIAGPLQTPPYAEAMFRISLRDERVPLEADIAGAVATRVKGQSFLYDPAARVQFLLMEAALLFRPIEHGAMAAQCHQIAQLSHLPSVEIHVVPIDEYLPVVPNTSFGLFEESLEIELQVGHIDERSAAVVARHEEVWQSLRSVARSGDDARAIIMSHAHRYAEEATRSQQLVGTEHAD